MDPSEPAYGAADVAEATDRLREVCAQLPEVTERVSHGAVTFFVRGKRVVAYLTDDHHGDGRLAVVCPAPPGVQEEVLRLDPERFFRPAYVGHRGWIGLRVDSTRTGTRSPRWSWRPTAAWPRRRWSAGSASPSRRDGYL